MAEQTNFKIFSGTAPRLRFTLTRKESVAGWTTKLYIRDKPGGTVKLAIDGAIASTVANAATLGIFDVPISAAQTIALTPTGSQHFSWTFERIDVGFQDVLGYGELTIQPR